MAKTQYWGFVIRPERRVGPGPKGDAILTASLTLVFDPIRALMRKNGARLLGVFRPYSQGNEDWLSTVCSPTDQYRAFEKAAAGSH